MGRRTSKKNKEIIGMDTDSVWYNTLWRERFRKRTIPKRVEVLLESFDRLGIEIKGYCSICWDPLTKDFPDDFPDRFKFCCMCRYIAKQIAYGESPEKYHILDDGTDRSLKIMERITLVEGNDR